MQEAILETKNDHKSWLNGALYRGEMHFRRLLEKLPAGAYTCDSEGLITYFNPRAVQLWGREPKLNDPVDRFCGSFRLFLADGTPIDHEDCWMGRALRDRQEYNSEEIIIERPDGRRLTALAHANPIIDEDGTLLGAVNVLVDISERKATEAAVRRAEQKTNELNQELERRVAERTAQLEAANKELESFAYSVSHDLRAPLRSIVGFSQILVEEHASKLDATALHYLERVGAASNRMGQLIDDLLELSRLSRSELLSQEVDLSRLAREILGALQQQDPGRSVTVTVAETCVVRGDRRLLRIALENLLGNAWKFTGKQESATIEFGCQEPEQGQRVCYVRDNGVGMDMAYADKLFTVFQRLHNLHEFPGNGIGLATVQRIIARHGGRIWATSVPNEGATLHFTIHCLPAPTHAEPLRPQLL
jgi:PAS domain S-box-containing protein